jgi:hypothetical protein
MERTQFSEMLAFKLQVLVNHPEESIKQNVKLVSVGLLAHHLQSRTFRGIKPSVRHSVHAELCACVTQPFHSLFDQSVVIYIDTCWY